MLPEGAEALAELRSPDFLTRFVSHVARLYLSGFYYVDHVPEMKLFFERNAGVVILFSIMLSGETADSFPPRGPVAISFTTLARQFGVSRSHVRRMVQEAINAGLLERDDTIPDGYRLLPALHAAFARITSLYILHNAQAARTALPKSRRRAKLHRDWSDGRTRSHLHPDIIDQPRLAEPRRHQQPHRAVLGRRIGASVSAWRASR